MNLLLRLIPAAAVLFMFSSADAAEELPLWEAGFGMTGLSLPDYRGSDEQRQYMIPFPYVIYRGEIIRGDRKGIYGRLFHSERIRLTLSADANVPVDSERNDARSGMPNLDPTFQIGPALEICLTSRCTDDNGVQLRLPLRAAFATDFTYLSGAGLIFNPQINVDSDRLTGESGWNLGFAVGPLYATQPYHEYYYGVEPEYAVPGLRNAYRAPGGYSGLMSVLSLSKRFDHTWFGLFCRYDDLHGAAFENSPLVRRKESLIAGFGVAWVFGKSDVAVNSEW